MIRNGAPPTPTQAASDTSGRQPSRRPTVSATSSAPPGTASTYSALVFTSRPIQIPSTMACRRPATWHRRSSDRK
jgi:hypothetical protein